MLLQFQDLCGPISALHAFLFYYGYGYSTTHTIVYTVLYDWLRIYSCASIKREGKSADDPYPSKSLAFCLFPSPQQQNLAETNEKKGGKKNKIVGHQSGSESLLSLENYPANNKDVLQRFTRRVYTQKQLIQKATTTTTEYTVYYVLVSSNRNVAFILTIPAASLNSYSFLLCSIYGSWYIYLSRRLRKYICIMALVVALCSG